MKREHFQPNRKASLICQTRSVRLKAISIDGIIEVILLG